MARILFFYFLILFGLSYELEKSSIEHPLRMLSEVDTLINVANSIPILEAAGTFLNNGKMVITWYANSGSSTTYGVFSQPFTSLGAKEGSQLKLTSTTGNYMRLFVQELSWTSSAYVISYSDPAGQYIKARFYSASHSMITEISLNSAAAAVDGPGICVLQNENIVFVYMYGYSNSGTTYYDIRFQITTQSGTKVAPNEVVVNTDSTGT